MCVHVRHPRQKANETQKAPALHTLRTILTTHVVSSSLPACLRYPITADRFGPNEAHVDQVVVVVERNNGKWGMPAFFVTILPGMMCEPWFCTNIPNAQVCLIPTIVETHSPKRPPSPPNKWCSRPHWTFVTMMIRGVFATAWVYTRSLSLRVASGIVQWMRCWMETYILVFRHCRFGRRRLEDNVSLLYVWPLTLVQESNGRIIFM